MPGRFSMATYSRFKVFHYNNACLGIATLRDNVATYKTDPKAYAWFEARDDAWLRDFRKVVRRLCKSAGHTSKLSIVEDIDSGIVVERIRE